MDNSKKGKMFFLKLFVLMKEHDVESISPDYEDYDQLEHVEIKFKNGKSFFVQNGNCTPYDYMALGE